MLQQVITSRKAFATFGTDMRRTLTSLRVLMLDVSVKIGFLVTDIARESLLTTRTFGDL